MSGRLDPAKPAYLLGDSVDSRLGTLRQHPGFAKWLTPTLVERFELAQPSAVGYLGQESQGLLEAFVRRWIATGEVETCVETEFLDEGLVVLQLSPSERENFERLLVDFFNIVAEHRRYHGPQAYREALERFYLRVSEVNDESEVDAIMEQEFSGFMDRLSVEFPDYVTKHRAWLASQVKQRTSFQFGCFPANQLIDAIQQLPPIERVIYRDMLRVHYPLQSEKTEKQIQSGRSASNEPRSLEDDKRQTGIER